MLDHEPQPRLYGCLYHTLYALTGNSAWLEHTEDISALRWHVRVHAAGYFLYTYWADDASGSTTPRAFWEQLRARATGASVTHLELILTIAGQSGDPTLTHMVAVAVPVDAAGMVTISDSACWRPQTCTYADFLDGPYAQAFSVQALGTADLAHYPFESGATRLMPREDAAYSM